MVVGAKKKFFNSEKDKELLHRCEEKFSAMQKRFSEEMKTTTENNS
jgi:hypothetical protein